MNSSRIINNTVAVHHAPRMIRQSGDIARQNMIMQRRRRAVFSVVSKTEPPTKTTSIGLEVTKSFTIHQAEISEGIIQYEVLEDDKLIWSGMGDDPAEGLLKIIIRIVDREDSDDLPDYT